MTTDERWIRQKTTNPAMCSKCGGKCCKQCGCAYFPKDLDMSFENLLNKLVNREISIDAQTYSGNLNKPLESPLLYLRVSNEGENTIAINEAGKCTLLGENGCKLSYDERPSGGRLIVPFWSGCYPLYSNDEFINAWLPHQKLLHELMQRLKED